MSDRRGLDRNTEARISDVAVLLDALHFAAHKHRSQRRKDVGGSPYINHPIAVARLLAWEGRVTDLPTLAGAILHDTLEDTETTPAELEAAFGSDIRALVEEMTDDKRLPKEVRKELQVEHARAASQRAKLIKIADKICNIRDVIDNPPRGWPPERRLAYLDWTERVVRGCRGHNLVLERVFDAELERGRAVMAAAAAAISDEGDTD